MRAPRIHQLEEYIFNKGTVSLDELCQTFEISMSTLRRDIDNLQENGSVKKVYGGVCRSSRNQVIPFNTRSSVHAAEKDTICRLASAYVKDNDIIFIDTGSTTCGIVNYLSELSQVTVITNNLDVIIRAMPYTNIHVLVLPGMLNRKNNSFSPTGTEHIFQTYNIQKAFMAASGISADGGVCHRDHLEGPIKTSALQKAPQRYLLVDDSKFSSSSLFTFSSITDYDAVFTNQPPPEAFLDTLSPGSVRFVYPSDT